VAVELSDLLHGKLKVQPMMSAANVQFGPNYWSSLHL